MRQPSKGYIGTPKETHALSHGGARCFGVMSVTLPGRGQADFGWILGIRNSHNMTYPAGLVAGTRVFVSDNLCFSGEVRISRKHTRFAELDLRHLTARAVEQLGDKFRGLDKRVDAYKAKCINTARAHDIVIRAVDCAAITAAQIPGVLQERRKPCNEEFAARSAFQPLERVYRGLQVGEPTPPCGGERPYTGSSIAKPGWRSRHERGAHTP